MIPHPGRPFCKYGGPPNGHMAKKSKNCAFLTKIGPTDPELLSALGRAYGIKRCANLWMPPVRAVALANSDPVQI